MAGLLSYALAGAAAGAGKGMADVAERGAEQEWEKAMEGLRQRNRMEAQKDSQRFSASESALGRQHSEAMFDRQADLTREGWGRADARAGAGRSRYASTITDKDGNVFGVLRDGTTEPLMAGEEQINVGVEARNPYFEVSKDGRFGLTSQGWAPIEGAPAGGFGEATEIPADVREMAKERLLSSPDYDEMSETERSEALNSIVRSLMPSVAVGRGGAGLLSGSSSPAASGAETLPPLPSEDEFLTAPPGTRFRAPDGSVVETPPAPEARLGPTRENAAKIAPSASAAEPVETQPLDPIEQAPGSSPFENTEAPWRWSPELRALGVDERLWGMMSESERQTLLDPQTPMENKRGIVTAKKVFAR